VGLVAGSINRDDIAAVRERARIDEVIGQHVALRSAGVDSLKGLCPFHEERSPSFNVRPSSGYWHCFGCGEGGDVIAFVMKVDGLPFAEAVEYLAEKAGVTLRYEAGGAPRSADAGSGRKRLLEMHRVAAAYFSGQLDSPEAKTGRDFLLERGFAKEAAEQFGVGYAPKGWTNLLDHLRGKGFTEAEMASSGLMSQGQQAAGGQARVYDRFRGRLVWPIRAATGDVIGFGARKLYPEDEGPKYLNTPETVLYKKSQVLFGLDLAKRAISSGRQVVVVEGYTDVMACHVAGVTTAVATCGTAFGEEHAQIVRRLMGDTDATMTKVGGQRPEVIFTFDGDSAGQNAALKAFTLDHRFLAQTYVAVSPDGMDPCDLRLQQGDGAVTALIAARVPLFEFVIKSALAGNDLESAEGRVAALRAAAPVIAGIRDTAIAPEYARRLAGWLGMEVEDVRRAVAAAAQRTPGATRGGRAPTWDGTPATGAVPQVSGVPLARPDARDPVVRAERLAIETLLQVPQAVRGNAGAWALYEQLNAASFTVPQFRALFDAVQAAGGPVGGDNSWVSRVTEEAGPTLAPLVSELAVTPLPHDKPEEFARYARSALARVQDLAITRAIAELRGKMQRAGEGSDAHREAFAELLALETRRRALRED